MIKGFTSGVHWTDYLEEFELYEEITVNGQEYILVHAGLHNFAETKKLSDYQLYEVIWEPTDYDKVYFKDKILITGHTPVQLISKGKSEKILKMNNHTNCCSRATRTAWPTTPS
ncbi:hypothetical protein SUBVAR_05734 [Subdoligranulum variabile DSM 15176]|uniref:Calcineurin-like phosphoesterase domain-containing protein n=1 Tax=Subdoligranulum variabile DSM 15176 TaxID=411471 RepID=D1PN18_9FIRM|nr:hypothetical protein SUBVAR_05734 [Subdoligranulum variabile DSM 15176]